MIDRLSHLVARTFLKSAPHPKVWGFFARYEKEHLEKDAPGEKIRL
jgi:hypothetical protein